MCGINGILNYRSSPEINLVKKMNQALAHRGPDNEGLYSDEFINLGHRRLSIIDLTEAGNQPYYSDDERYVMVYNGELYNYREIKASLTEINFKTATDTEVILKAFIKYGISCVKQFNGMFAFAIWDKQAKELILCRDRMGVKPLYYAFVNDNLVFSSEIRALLESNLVERKLNVNKLSEYLQFQTVYAPDTIINNVKVLMPGSYMIVAQSGIKIEKYWDPSSYVQDCKINNYKEVCAHTFNLLEKSVERRLVADVPFGAFLSGGIDSSAIVALMSKIQRQPVNTFSITFNEKDYTEEKYSRLIAEKYQTKHTEIKLSVNDFKNLLPQALKALDHPSGDGANTYVVSKYTKEAGITMALSGIGGDELFAGYNVFIRMPRLNKLKSLQLIPLALRKAVATALRKFKPGVSTQKLNWLLSANKLHFSTLYNVNRMLFAEDELRLFVKDEIVAFNQPKTFNEFNLNKNHSLSAISIAEFESYLQNILLRDADQMSMAHALEIREPFIDHELIEFVLSVPDHFKYPHKPKKLLLDSLGDLIPPEVYNRQKMGFTFPWKHWMQNDLKNFCEDRLISFSKRQYFKGEGVILMWNQFLQNHPEVTWSRLWPLIVLEDWMQTNNIS